MSYDEDSLAIGSGILLLPPSSYHNKFFSFTVSWDEDSLSIGTSFILLPPSLHQKYFFFSITISWAEASLAKALV